MRLILLESERSFFRSAEFATVSIVTHVALVWFVLTTSTGTFRLPTTEREARVMFLLPPDPVAAPKVAADFAKGNEKFVILGGALGKTIMDAAAVKALAELPSLDQLRAKLVGMIQTPATRIAGVVQAPAGQLARVINAYATKDKAA